MFGLSCSVQTGWRCRTQVRNLVPYPPKAVSSLAPLNDGRIVNAWRAAGSSPSRWGAGSPVH